MNGLRIMLLLSALAALGVNRCSVEQPSGQAIVDGVCDCVEQATTVQPAAPPGEFLIVDATDSDAMTAALSAGWSLVNCSVGIGRGFGRGDGAVAGTTVTEHCYFVR